MAEALFLNVAETGFYHLGTTHLKQNSRQNATYNFFVNVPESSKRGAFRIFIFGSNSFSVGVLQAL